MSHIALDGVRVVDLSRGIAGPSAAMYLADFGADVVKVEPPEGDPGRDRPGFAMWNRNKRSLALDPREPADHAALLSLIAGADVVIAGGQDDLLPAEFGPDAICARHPGLVYVSVPPYLGPTPWAGGAECAAFLAAEVGVTLRQNSTDGGPVDPVFTPWSYVHGIWTATATVAALIERQTSGYGQHVTVGGLHGTLVLSTNGLVIDPEVVDSPITAGPGGPSPMYSRYRCSDGVWIFLAALTPRFQQITIATLGLDDILADPRIDGDLEKLLQPANRWARQRFTDTFASNTSEHWVQVLRTAGVPTTALLDRADWLDGPEVAQLGLSHTVSDPDRGTVTMPANPIMMTETPPSIRTSAPRLPIVGNGAGPQPLPEWEPRPAPTGERPPVSTAGPLAGIRILDLGAVLAGPYAGTLLADLGAEVIKAEIPAGDSFRGRGMQFIRGQRGLAIDLTRDDAREVFYSLVREADVVLDNFRVGILHRLQVDYARLTEVNPDVIGVTITSVGEEGPLAKDPAFDALLQSRSGMFTAQGGDDEPVVISVPIIDATTATLATLGTVVALFHRGNVGAGQRVHVTMAGAATVAQSEELIRFEGRTPPATGGANFRGPHALDRYYATGDGWVRIHLPADGAADRLAAAGLLTGGLPEEETERVAVLSEAFANRQRAEVLAALFEAGVPAAPARLQSEVANDPYFRSAGVLTELPRADQGPLMAPGRYALFSRTQRTDTLVPPGVGEHTAEILGEAGYDADRIDALSEAGAIGQGEPFIHRTFAAYR